MATRTHLISKSLLWPFILWPLAHICIWLNNPPLVCAHGSDASKAFSLIHVNYWIFKSPTPLIWILRVRPPLIFHSNSATGCLQ
ncbi:hypothetical protein HanXRQr2_Chr09g0375711 [Helianthus annuus]|uniref:Secreted protein n=1 Tax=Helianthus annuus TaxID=4232 RepID=A0A9K3I4L5_HELAN|nr:hypothetical protein HanXRQr2_Chr09g0375711 [Helianthus annuus]KAJ0892138.1 hypothetical protein HanPSC8_Chr09g0362331 [Helianthus annuus]